LLVASGYMVHEAREALPMLQEQGIEATLVDLYSMPFDGDLIATLAEENHGRVLTLEDNYGGGLGSAVADALAEYGGLFTVKQLFVRQIPKSGRTPDDVLRHLGLSAEDIVKSAVDILAVTPR
jgi:transketolase